MVGLGYGPRVWHSASAPFKAYAVTRSWGGRKILSSPMTARSTYGCRRQLELLHHCGCQRYPIQLYPRIPKASVGYFVNKRSPASPRTSCSKSRDINHMWLYNFQSTDVIICCTHSRSPSLLAHPHVPLHTHWTDIRFFTHTRIYKITTRSDRA